MGRIIYRMAVAIRGALPLIFGIILAALAFVPFGEPEIGVVLPSLTLPLVYYWSIYRPSLMPPAVAFFIGLWQDILIGGPLGLMAMLLVLMRGAAETQRPVFRTQSFFVVWMGFAVISLALMFVGWLVASSWYWNGFDVVPFIGQWVLGVVVYLPLAWLFGLMDRALFEVRRV